MKGVDLVVSDDFADVVVGEVYDSSAEAYDYVAHAIPSIDGLRAEFCAEFHRLAPGCEISAVPMVTRAIEITDGSGASSLCRRRKLYGKARVDMAVVYAGGVGLVEHVRGACLLAAHKMAATIATMAGPGSPMVELGGRAVEIRWSGGGPLHWPGISYTGRPRVAVEFSRDSIVLLLASYFVLLPAGTVVLGDPAS